MLVVISIHHKHWLNNNYSSTNASNGYNFIYIIAPTMVA